MSELNCLIVDDDPLHTVVAESILGSITTGRVVSASSGKEALAILGQEVTAIDVVLLDLNMPDLDGLAFMRAAVEAGFAGSIVISSGESPAVLRSAETMGKMLGLSVLGALAKPLKPHEMAQMLQRVASRRAPELARLKGFCRDDCELTPYYQPQYDLASKKIAGLEALIRVTDSNGRVYGPAEVFQSIVSQEDLADVSLKIARKVLSDTTVWRLSPPTVSINMDASVLERADVVSDLQKSVIEYSIDPRHVCLELTERSLPKDLSWLLEALTRLRMSGFRLSLDDYGTGASSFELLRLCPFSEVKVDRTIIQGCPTDPVSRKFLQSVGGLARDLGLTSVAEGVENDAELSEARAAGIDRVQGFLFSRPVPPDRLAEMASEFQMDME